MKRWWEAKLKPLELTELSGPLVKEYIKQEAKMKIKNKHYLLGGFILGMLFWFSIMVYGDQVAKSAYQEFKNALRVNTALVEFNSTTSDSKIVLYWNEKEKMPYKAVITVRVGDDKKKKVRAIVFKKQ